MNLLHEIYLTLLLEGKTPEEIRDIIIFKYKDKVPLDIIDATINIDPTVKKSYSMWALSKYEKEPNRYKNALRDGKLKRFFDYSKSHADVQPTSFKTLKDAIMSIGETDILLSKKEGTQDENDFDIVYDSSNWKIAVPNSYEASCKLGKDTRWCTADAYGNGLSYYKNYTNDGPLFVNFDMRKTERLNHNEYPYKRYQFHFATNSFLDAHDDPFTLDEANIPKEVMDWYSENGYDTTRLGMDEEKLRETYEMQRYEDAFAIFGDLSIMRDYNYELIWENGPDDDFDYYIYDSNDDQDPVIYTAVKQEIEERGPLWAIIPSKLGTTVVVYCDNSRLNIRRWCAEELHKGGYFTDGDYLYFLSTERIIESNGSFADNVFLYCAVNGSVKRWKIDGAKHVDDIFISLSPIKHNGKGYIELVQANNGRNHQLYEICGNGELKTIIHGDIPISGTSFELSEDGFVHGRLKKYSLDGDDNNDNHIRKLISRMSNDRYLMVLMDDGLKNVYDKLGESLVFGKNFEDIRECIGTDMIIAGHIDRDKSDVAIYSLDGRKLTKNYSAYGYDQKLKIFALKQDDGRAIILDKNMRQFGPFDKICTTNCGGKNILVKIDGEPRTLNTETGEIGLTWAISYRYPKTFGLGYGNPAIVCSKEGEDVLYNTQTNRIIANNLDPVYDGPQEVIDMKTRSFLCRFADGKYNIVDIFGNRLFKNNMIEINGVNDHEYITGLDRSVFFVYSKKDERFVPTNKGMNRDMIRIDFNKDLVYVYFPNKKDYVQCSLSDGTILNCRINGEYTHGITQEIINYVNNILNINNNKQNEGKKMDTTMMILEDIFDDIMAAHPEWNTETYDDIMEKYKKEEEFDDRIGDGDFKIQPPYTFYDKNGKPLTANFIHPFHNDFAIVERNGLSTFIDKSGRMITDEWFKNVNNFECGHGFVRRRSGLCNYVNEDGTFLLNSDVSRCGDFMNGVGMVIDGGRMYKIDTEGNEI